MTPQPLVTAIIPCFNAAATLLRAIDSVRAQSYPNIEIIAVDDGSRDGTLALLREQEALGVRVRRISIRDQSSRWGSCTSAGSLSFSWRLILAPTYVLDYLAAHEVAHLVEMNHSTRFWKVVAKVCNHVERAKTWLDTHGNDLHRYGIQD